MAEIKESAIQLRRRIQQTYIGEGAPADLIEDWVTQELVEQSSRIAKRNAEHQKHWEALRQQRAQELRIVSGMSDN